MKTCLFSVSYAGLWGQASLTLPEFIPHAAELGYDAVLLMGKRPHLSGLDLSREHLAEIKSRLADSGLACLGTAAYTNFTANAPYREVPLNEIQLLYLKRLCEMTAELNGQYIRVFTGYSTQTLSSDEAWNQCVAALRECGDIAQSFGLLVGVQNHHDIAVETRAMQMLLEEVGHPSVRSSFDCWSPFLRGEDVYASARVMAACMINTTCADYVSLPTFWYRADSVNYERNPVNLVRAVPMGTGDLDYKAFFQGLKEGGYQGPVTYEMCSPLHGGGSLKNLDRYAGIFLDYMRGLEGV
jgi:sugar phosphate isomerase/epimerase